jgi:hypothetical protein
MRRISTIGNLNKLAEDTIKPEITVDYSKYKEVYSIRLIEVFGCCLEDIEKVIAARPTEVVSQILESFSSLFTSSIQCSSKVKLLSLGVIVNLLEQTYPQIFQATEIEAKADISSFNATGISYLQKIPRIIFICSKLNNIYKNQHLEELRQRLFNNIIEHIILPDKTKEVLLLYFNAPSNSLGMSIDQLPTTRLLDTLIFGGTYPVIDHLKYFKHLRHGDSIVFTPLVGLDEAGVFYTSQPTDINSRGLLNYFDFLPEKTHIIAISANRINLCEDKIIEQTKLELDRRSLIEIKFAISQLTQVKNIIDRFVVTNRKLLTEPVITKNRIMHEGKIIDFYQLPHIEDLFYGHKIVQTLIAESLIAIDDDINEQKYQHLPIIINCEKGKNRSKAIYEAMIELKYPYNNPQLAEVRTNALEASLPEIMTHFTAHDLDENKYLGYDYEGNRINPIAKITQDYKAQSHEVRASFHK